MTNIATNNQFKAGYNKILLNHTSILAAARSERSIEIARLLTIAGKAIAKFGRVFWAVIEDLREYNRNVRELEALSDSTLKDIGLYRGEIAHAVRIQMDAAKQKAAVTASVEQLAVTVETTSPAANGNEIESHELAA